MFRPRIIPVLTIMNKGLVKTINFDKKKCRYIGDPINAVRIFNDLEADELIFLDITASLQKRCISADLVKKIGEEAFMPFSVGGGITNLKQIQQLITGGAEKVIINTSCIKNPELINQASREFGNQSIVASIDVRKNFMGEYNLYIEGGTKKIDFPVNNMMKNLEERGAGEIMITSINCDGKMSGYDLELIAGLSNMVNIPVIACGGAGDISHMAEVTLKAGASAAAAGSMFVFHGARRAVLVNYPDKNELVKYFN